MILIQLLDTFLFIFSQVKKKRKWTANKVNIPRILRPRDVTDTFGYEIT